MRGTVAQRLEGGLGADHARLHRRVRAFDLRHVQEARGVADDGAAGEDELRDRLEAAFRQRPGAIGDAPRALEDRPDRRVRLEALHLLEGRHPGVPVVEPDDEAHRQHVLPEHVHPRAAIGAAVHRPADRVHDLALDVLLRRQLPQLLDAQAIGLRLHAVPEVEALEQRLRQRAAAALGEQRQPVPAAPRRADGWGRARRPCRCPCRRWRRPPPARPPRRAPRPRRSRDRPRRPAPPPARPASGRHCRG